ncbi:putative non-specific serine/threonine protein kinase [Rosa chinensis]|uniref:Putative non-specific serine/threonine protein kinase n=1 Tax=Rosa chinensis TaxID=74649 RepID=A0A2P6SID4_ROSCH|nr:putative non-specific serine/threonine protein kinase [Rosa chinensis]
MLKCASDFKGTPIPSFLGSLKKLRYLDLSASGFEGMVPPHLGNLSNLLVSQHTQIFPFHFGQNVTQLGLASNRFSGPIPLNIGQEMSNMETLDVSKNNLNGSIPTSISKMKILTSLDLSRNYLSRNILRDWKGLQKLNTIDFFDNNLSGKIPNSMCSEIPSLHWLRISNNNFSEEIELSLRNCTKLFTLDLRGNKFSGTLPKWIGETDPCMHPHIYF